jgi:Flp pilus assembly secretin CpaC
MKAGHTLALAGDYREETETEKRGIPVLMHAPIIGSAFRRTTEQTSEQELVFLITPRFITEVDPTYMPRLGPGQLTDKPSDHELFLNGYLEVPNCNDDCPVNDRFDDPANYDAYPNYPLSLDPANQPQSSQDQVPMNQSDKQQQTAPDASQFKRGGQFPGVETRQTTPTGYGSPVGGIKNTNSAYRNSEWPQGN